MSTPSANNQEPDLQIAALCEYVLRDEDHKPSCIGIFNMLYAAQFPADFRFWLFTSWMNALGDHRFVLNIYQPDGEQMATTEPYAFTLGSEVDPVYVFLELALTFRQPGDYRFEIVVDGRPKLAQTVHLWTAAARDNQAA